MESAPRVELSPLRPRKQHRQSSLDKLALPERGRPAFAGDGYGQAVVLGLIQGVVSGAIQCEAIKTAKEQKSVSLAKRAEATYAEYRRQKASGSGGRGFRLPL